MHEIIAQLIKTEPTPKEFNLEIWILEQKLKQAQANTDAVIKEIK